MTVSTIDSLTTGCLFLILSVHHLRAIINRYFQSKVHGYLFRPKLWYNVKPFSHIPIESLLKTCVFAAKTVIDTAASDDKPTLLRNLTIDAGFLLASIVELVYCFDKYSLAFGFETWTWIQAFAAQVVICGSHNLGGIVGAVPSTAAIVALLLRFIHPHNLSVAIFYPAVLMIQGIWNIQVALPYYSESEDNVTLHSNPHHLMAVILRMVWITVGSYIFIMLLFGKAMRSYNNKSSSKFTVAGIM